MHLRLNYGSSGPRPRGPLEQFVGNTEVYRVVMDGPDGASTTPGGQSAWGWRGKFAATAVSCLTASAAVSLGTSYLPDTVTASIASYIPRIVSSAASHLPSLRTATLCTAAVALGEYDGWNTGCVTGFGNGTDFAGMSKVKREEKLDEVADNAIKVARERFQ